MYLQNVFRYDELFAPVVGPHNPFKTQQEAATKNTLAGFVEDAHVNAFQFELQRRTFHSYGYAYDPSTTAEGEGDKLVGNSLKAKENDTKTVFEDTRKRPLDKRKKDRNDDPSDIDGYLGPWAKFKDEETVSHPNDAEAAYLEEYLAKKKKRGKVQNEVPLEEKSQLHIKDTEDYQGRSFLHPPQDVGVNFKSSDPPPKCFIPKRQIHTWQGHNKGVAVIRWFPSTAHLLLSGSNDNKVKLWEVYNKRRCVRTYVGHKLGIRDVNFNNAGDRFLTASYDRSIKMWDTETGDVVGRFTNNKMAFCVKFNPNDDKQHLIVAGTSSNKIICWDIRSGDIVQEYDRHLAAVNTITFVDRNRRFITTSDDKSLRVWEWNIPVDMKYIAGETVVSSLVEIIINNIVFRPEYAQYASRHSGPQWEGGRVPEFGQQGCHLPGGGQVQGDEEEGVQGPHGGGVRLRGGLQPRDVLLGQRRRGRESVHLGLEDYEAGVQVEGS